MQSGSVFSYLVSWLLNMIYQFDTRIPDAKVQKKIEKQSGIEQGSIFNICRIASIVKNKKCLI